MSCVFKILFIFITYSISYSHFGKRLDLRNMCLCVYIYTQAMCIYVCMHVCIYRVFEESSTGLIRFHAHELRRRERQNTIVGFSFRQ